MAHRLLTGLTRIYGAGITPGPYLLDQFTGTNGDLITAHAIAPNNTPGATWAYIGTPEPTIQNNKLFFTRSLANAYYVTCDSLVSDYTLSATLSGAEGSSQVGLVYRFTNTSNFFMATVRGSPFSIFEIWEVTTGSASIRASTAVSFAPGATLAFSATLSGTSHTATVNGANTLTYTSAVRQTVTKVGVHGWSETIGKEVQWDNFQVTI